MPGEPGPRGGKSVGRLAAAAPAPGPVSDSLEGNMSEQTPSEQPEAEARPETGERRPGSKWIAVGLLVLLGGWFVVTQTISRTGEQIQWLDSLPAAEKLAHETGRRILLVLHEPDCEITAANDRDLFSQRFARAQLAKMVCCRVELKPGDPLRRRFGFTSEPLVLVLKPNGELLHRLTGRITRLQFETFVVPAPGDEAD